MLSTIADLTVPSPIPFSPASNSSRSRKFLGTMDISLVLSSTLRKIKNYEKKAIVRSLVPLPTTGPLAAMRLSAQKLSSIVYETNLCNSHQRPGQDAAVDSSTQKVSEKLMTNH